MQGQGDGSESSINPEQSQFQSIHEWLDQETPSSLISQMVQSGIGTESQRRAFVELMNHVDAELTARGIGFQRSNPETANNGQFGNGPPMEQQGNVSAALTDSNIDLNETYEGNSNLPMKPDELEAADQNLPDATSSNPILISPGGSALEEEQGDSSNGRLLSFKRRAPGDASRQLLLGESSRSENDVAAHENASGALNDQSNDNHLGQLEAVTGVGMGADSAMNGTQNVAAGEINVLEADIGGDPTVNHYQPSANGFAGGYVMNQSLIVARNGIGNQDSIRARQEEIQRNIRVRRNPNLQDFTPVSLLTHNTMNSQVQPPSQIAIFFPHDHFVNSRTQPVHIAPAPQFVQVPEPFQTQQAQVLGQGLTMSGATPQGNFGNNPRNVIFPDGFEAGNFPHVTANMNLGNRNTNFPGNAASLYASDSNLRISAVPIWYPHQAIRYSNRMLEILSRGENRGLQGDYRPAHAGSAAAAEDMENSARGGNMRPRIRLRRSRLMPSVERQEADYSGSSRRGQQLVHNASELARRGGGLTFEGVMMLNRSLVLGLPEEDDDVHEDMRLDIDDMSYEELIALGDEIGNVSTGLREEAILANLRVQKYNSFEVESPDNPEPCCVCQEQYAEGEHVGKLDCGHDFHTNCIKQWLLQKNQCPICKEKGLAGNQREQ